MSENLFGLTVAADKGLDDLQCQRLLIRILDSNIESRIPCAAHTRIVRKHAAPSHAESDAPLAL